MKFMDFWIIFNVKWHSFHNYKVATDSSDSDSEADQSLDDRPEYQQAEKEKEEESSLEGGEQPDVGALEERFHLVPGNLNLEEQLNRVKLGEGTLSSSSILKEGVGASFGEAGSAHPHIDIGSLGANSTIVIGTHITMVSENTKPINTSPSTTPGGSNPALDTTSSGSLTTSSASSGSGQRPCLSSNLDRQTEDIRFYFTSQLGHATLPWIVQPAPQFENFTVEIF